jgi:hypothetical protein
MIGNALRNLGPRHTVSVVLHRYGSSRSGSPFKLKNRSSNRQQRIFAIEDLKVAIIYQFDKISVSEEFFAAKCDNNISK